MPKKPTAAQAAALDLIAKGDVYRWEHSGDTWVVAGDTIITKVTMRSLTQRGWVECGDLAGIKRPVRLTDAGRAARG